MKAGGQSRRRYEPATDSIFHYLDGLRHILISLVTGVQKAGKGSGFWCREGGSNPHDPKVGGF